MNKVLFIATALMLFASLAGASNLTGPEGGWMNKTLTGPISSATAPPPIAGALLLEDGTSFLLLEDGSSHFCLEGGC
jgi:hypothetical protein